jgi:hypothetical protein
MQKIQECFELDSDVLNTFIRASENRITLDNLFNGHTTKVLVFYQPRKFEVLLLLKCLDSSDLYGCNQDPDDPHFIPRPTLFFSDGNKHRLLSRCCYFIRTNKYHEPLDTSVVC